MSLVELATGEVVRTRLLGRGHGPKCLLVHGNPGSLEDWETLLPLLESELHLALLELPGFGQSLRAGKEPEALSLSRLADVVVAVADALGFHEPFFVVGHSHGGGVAQVVAARYPARVAGLVLLGTLGYPAHSSYRLLALPGASGVAALLGKSFQTPALRSLVRPILRAVLRDFYWPEPVPTSRVEQELKLFEARPEILVSMVHVALGRPCDQLLSGAAQIRCPVLLVHGDADRLVPVAYARAIERQISESGGRASLQILAGAGHLLIEFQASDIARALLDFVRHASETVSGSIGVNDSQPARDSQKSL